MKVHTKLIKAFGALLVMVLLFAAMPAGEVTAAEINVDCSGGCDQTQIQTAIDSASSGDNVNVSGGPIVFTAGVTVKAGVTLNGVGDPLIQVSGTGPRFTMQDGSTLQGFQIEKTDKTGVQNIIYVGSDNVSVLDNTIWGRYVFGDSEVSRAFEVAYGSNNLTISGNTIYDLRQPGYLNGSLTSPTTGTISNNNVYSTRGWVLAGANMTYTGNTWGDGSNPNIFDIVILSGTDASYYPDIIAVSDANNMAVVEDQRVSPAVLSVAYVDDDAPSGGNGGAAQPYQTIGAGITRVIAGGTVKVSAGNYASIGVSKSVTLLGPNAGVHPAVGTHPTETVGTRGPEAVVGGLVPSADDITVDGFKFSKAGTRIIDTYADADNFTMRNCIVESTVYGATTGVMQFGGGSHTDMLVEFNLFMDEGDHTFYAAGGPYDGMTFQYNKFQGAGDSFFWAATPLVDGVIKGNEFDGESGANFNTMNIGQAGNLQLLDNWFHDNYYTGVQVGVINGTISGNKFESSYPYDGYWGSGLELWGGQYGTAVSTNVTVTGNEFYYNDIAGADYPSHGIRLRAPETGSGIDGSTIHIYCNEFYDGGERSDAYAIWHQGDQTTSVDADANYWGSATPDFTGKFSGPVTYLPYNTDTTCGTPVYPPVHNITQDTWFYEIQPAIADANADDTIEVAAGTYVEEGQIVIDKDLTIIGEDKTTTFIKPDQNTGSSGDARGWFLVQDGVEFNLSNFTLDGAGFDIHQGIRSLGSGTINNNIVKNISYPGYNGIGMVMMGDYNMTFSNNTFSNIGRIGMMAYGSGVTDAQIIDNSYTGKGGGDSLDYGIEIGGGAIATISGNIITGIGESTTAWSNAAIMVTTYYGSGSEATITGNNIHDNYKAIHVGYDETDTSLVTVNENLIVDNEVDIVSTAPFVDAELNYWGSPCGPTAVYGDVDFTPWYSDEAMTTEESEGTVSGEVTFAGDATLEFMQGQVTCAVPDTVFNYVDGEEYPGGLLINRPGLTFNLNGATVDPGSPAYTVLANYTVINGPGLLDGDGSTDDAIVVADGVIDFTLDTVEITGWADGLHFDGVITDTVIVDNFIHDNTGDAVYFGAQPVAQTDVSFYIQGNLFKHNAGVGVNNAGTTDVNAEYNSWSEYEGPTGTDWDGSTNADTDPFTHVDLYMVSTNPDVDNWPNQVFVDDSDPITPNDTITYQVKAHVVNLTGASFDLNFPTTLVSAALGSVNSDFSAVPGKSDVVTIDSGVISFDGITGETLATVTPLSGDIVLFEVTFTGVAPGTASLDFDEDTDEFSMSPDGGGPSNNIYADELVDATLDVITRPTLDVDGLDTDFVAGLTSHEITLQTCSLATGGDWTESVTSPIEPDTIGWVRISDITKAEIDSIQFLYLGSWYEFSVQNAVGGTAVQQNGDDVIARFGNYDYGLEIPVDWCDVDKFRITFVNPGTHDVTIEIYDMMDTSQDYIGGDDILLAYLGPESITVLGDFDVTGTVSMQGRTVRSGVPLTLTDVDGDPTYGPHETDSTSQLALNVLFEGVNGSIYRVTTLQPRYLNVTADLEKLILVNGAFEMQPLELQGGNAVWEDNNIINIGDASLVGAQYNVPDTDTSYDENADVNFDGKVNIQDLALVGGNFDLDSAEAYADWIPDGDETLPTLESVDPAEGTVELASDESFVLTVDASDTGDNLYELEIDHSLEGTVPEFSVYANAANPYGTDADKAEFETYGVVVTYFVSEQKWTIDFGDTVTSTYFIGEDVTFYIKLIDFAGNAFGSMDPTTPANTFSYSITLE